MQISRVCEAEIMDSAGECELYQSIVSKHARFLDRPFVAQVLRRSRNVRRLLDVGTGPGLIPILICGANPDINITAVDLSRNMLAMASAEAVNQGLAGRISWETEDAKSLSYEDNSFDMVISHAMLHHLADPVPALNEMARVLKPGGTLLLKDIARPPRWVVPIWVAVLGTLVGYTVEEKAILEESLLAAFSTDEIRRHVAGSDLRGASAGRTSPTHFTVEYVKPA